MKKFKYVILLIGISIIINTKIVYGKDYFVENNGEVEVVISANELNRVKVFHDRIKDVRANADELRIEADKSTGEIYIKPTIYKDAIDVFLKTENGFTYKVIMKVKKVKSQQVFLNRQDFNLDNYANAETLRKEKLKLINDNLYFNFDDDYKLSAINLIRAMMSRANLQGFSIIDREEEGFLRFKNLDVKWISSYNKNDKSGVSGEIIKIKNTSNQKIEINEDMFLKRGIRAVSLDKTSLDKKESCYGYLVGGDNNE